MKEDGKKAALSHWIRNWLALSGNQFHLLECTPTKWLCVTSVRYFLYECILVSSRKVASFLPKEEILLSNQIVCCYFVLFFFPGLREGHPLKFETGFDVLTNNRGPSPISFCLFWAFQSFHRCQHCCKFDCVVCLCRYIRCLVLKGTAVCCVSLFYVCLYGPRLSEFY